MAAVLASTSRMPGPPWAFVADDDHITRPDSSVAGCGYGSFAGEAADSAGERARVIALDRCAVRCERAVEDGQAAGWVQFGADVPQEQAPQVRRVRKDVELRSPRT